MRLFVAITLPDETKRHLRFICGGLPNARWVAEENFHLTLRFLGELDGREMAFVDAALAGIRAPRFTLRLKGVDAFSSGTKVKAVYAGVEKSAALQHLRDKVESAVVRAGIKPEGQKFTPHVTLTRPKDPPIGKLKAYLAEHSLFRTPEFDVTHFTLFSSFLGGEGPIYSAERSYVLTEPRAAQIETQHQSGA